MTTAFSISPFRKVHDVNVRSKNGRMFVVDIYENGNASYDSTVTVLDGVSTNPGSWLYNASPTSPTAIDNFKASVELILAYLASVDTSDSVTDVHNPCNCPFVSEGDQNQCLSNLGLPLSVRVN